MLAVFNKSANVPADLPVYYLMGNHDNYSADGNDNYLSKLQQPMNQYIEIKDYPFITLSMVGGREDDYDAETQTFLSTHLASAAQKYPDKPIFVFPPQNTCVYLFNMASSIILRTFADIYKMRSHEEITDRYPVV
ncbi:hypothetical protein AGMMS49982_23610 [Bacteroidia bacterium]|nr:hypothetical protein AGMMS49982_23610 [Bacteroidia bacterium]